jgi:DNA (cytosine-5)-methyltransferase 1
MGYHRAGFDVTGVDINAQPHYPRGGSMRFIQADAMTFPLEGYDAYHASPPCQRYSRLSNCRPGLAETYPDYIAAIRERLEATGKPYVIENVPGAPLRNPIKLCGWTFNRQTYRHRHFESNVPIEEPEHRPHTTPASKAARWVPGTFVSVAGHCSPIRLCREVMDINWMPRNELAEAIPPYFTHHVGYHLQKALGTKS